MTDHTWNVENVATCPTVCNFNREIHQIIVFYTCLLQKANMINLIEKTLFSLFCVIINLRYLELLLI